MTQPATKRLVTEAALTTYAAARWQATRAYTSGDLALAPDGTIIQRNANGTSRASYDATEQALWTVKTSGGGGSSDLADVSVAGTSAQLAAGKTSNVAAGGAYTSPALDGAVATPPKRWAIKAASTGGCTITYPDQAGTTQTVTLLAGEVLTFRQKTASGWGAESGNKPLTQIDNWLGARAPYLGPVSTRGRIPSGTIASSIYKQTMNWSRHVATDNAPALQLLYSSIVGIGEVAVSAGPGTVKASVEYPVGTFTQVTFGGGATSGTIPANDHYLSDMVTLAAPIPAGATFWVGTYVNWTGTNTPLMSDGLSAFPVASTREALQASTTSVTDTTMTGVRNTGGTNARDTYRPTAVLAMTRKPSIFLAGDSRTRAALAWDLNTDSFGYQGLTEAVIAGRFATINAGVGTDTYTNVLSGTGNNYVKRLALAAYCSHIVDDYGINSVFSDTTAAHQANVAAFRAKFPANKPYFKTTLAPQLTAASTSIALDGSDQTPSGTLLKYTDNNAWVRQGAGGLIDGFIEIEDLVSLKRDSCKFKPAERRVTDAAMTSGSNIVTSATAAFTSSDVDKVVTVLGAGAAGAALIGLVSAVTSATTVTLKNPTSGSGAAINASTTVSGATAGIGHYNVDGVHQSKVLQAALVESNAYRVLANLK